MPKWVNKLRKSPKKVKQINRWFESLSHDLILINISDSFLILKPIWIKILESFFESWVDLNQNVLEAFGVMSRFDSNLRNPFWVVSWFESIIVKPCESWVESNRNFWDWVESNKKTSCTHVWWPILWLQDTVLMHPVSLSEKCKGRLRCLRTMPWPVWHHPYIRHWASRSVMEYSRTLTGHGMGKRVVVRFYSRSFCWVDYMSKYLHRIWWCIPIVFFSSSQ